MIKEKMLENRKDLLALGFQTFKVASHTKTPIEKWGTEAKYHKDIDYFTGCNIGIKCGELVEGTDYRLVILDVDPRNGGNEALKYLCQENDITIDTLSVTTGSGGKHYYFLTTEELGSCELLKGLDFKAKGGYCAGPGSIHKNDSLYCFDFQPSVPQIDIAEIPENLAKLVKEKRKAFFTHPEEFHEKESYGEGERNSHLLKYAGALRRQGFGYDEIFTALSTVNIKKCKPVLPERELIDITKSVLRYTPEGASATALETVKIEIAAEKTLPPKDNLDNIYTAIKSVGLKSIADTILKNVDREYKHIAVGTALSVIGTVAQGSYTLPSWYTGKHLMGLSGYYWLIGPSAAGKDAYRHAAGQYLQAVHPRILFSNFGSNNGLRANLFVSNSGIAVMDEFQDELSKLNRSSGSPYLTQLLSDYKELHNELNEFKSIQLTKIAYPAIELPRLSILALGTIEGFNRQLTNDIVGGGLLSRFSVWPMIKVPKRSFNSRLDRADIPKAELEMLKSLYDVGLSAKGRSQIDTDELTAFYGISTKNPATHMAQSDPKTRLMALSNRARDMLIDFHDTQQSKYFGYLEQNLGERDFSPGSIVDRAPRQAYKYAGLHALSDFREEVGEHDMNFGIVTATLLTNYVVERLTERETSNINPVRMANLQRVLGYFMKVKSARKRDVQQRFSGNMSSRDLDDYIISLVHSDKLIALDSIGEPKDLPDGATTITKGFSFMIKK